MFDIDPELKDILIKLLVSVLVGGILGGEREYRNKSAGIRTIILICLGSTLFTILSVKIGDATGASRVAANIVTGIGFLGAGAIMREGLNISGMTTASTIWVAAALGMAIGAGEFAIAFYSMGITFVVLTVFTHVQKILLKLKRTIELHLTIEDRSYLSNIEDEMKTNSLKFSRVKEFRKEDKSLFQYDVVGSEERLNRFIRFLNESSKVKSFDY